MGPSKAKPKGNKISIAAAAKKIKLAVFDFDGVFTDNRVLVFSDGTEAVYCNREDSWGLNLLKKAGVEIRVISTEKNPVVGARCLKMGITCIQGCDDKLKALKEQAVALQLKLDQVAYLGNDANDLQCLRAVGLAAGVQDAHASISGAIHYRTEKRGGHGAVREFCELIIRYKTRK